MEVRPANLSSAGTHDKISVASNAVTTIDSIRPQDARHALIAAETQAIRWLDDGATPTTSDGFPLAAGSDFLFSGDLDALKMIAQTGTAVVTIMWYR